MNDDELSDQLDKALQPIQTRRKEHELHRQWVASGKKPELLSPLLDHYRPELMRYSDQYSKGAKMVNPVALQTAMTGMMVKAFDTWDPDKGASLTTHVINHFQPAKRQVVKAQNVGRIPEADAFRIGDIQRAEQHGLQELGRAPTPKEIAERVGLKESDVVRIRKRMVRDVPTGAFEVDALGSANRRDLEVQPLIRQELSEKDRAVFDLIYHPENPKLSTGEIAKALKRPDYDVSDSKSRILATWKKYR